MIGVSAEGSVGSQEHLQYYTAQESAEPICKPP